MAEAYALIVVGLDVASVEQSPVGASVRDWGCIPPNMMVRAAGPLAEAAA